MMASNSSHDYYTSVKQQPSTSYRFQDDVIGITWIPKQQQDKEKFYIYTKNGYIEEKSYTEKNFFVFDMSARGHICMSGMHKKTSHAIPFFDSVFNFE